MDFSLVYSIAKEVIDGRLTRDDAALEIVRSTGMNIATAKIHIADLIDMFRGKMYTRTISVQATKCFIESLKMDYGNTIYQNAVNATREHVKYYNSLGGGKRNSIASLLKEYE